MTKEARVAALVVLEVVVYKRPSETKVKMVILLL